jgi:hypothetical protein
MIETRKSAVHYLVVSQHSELGISIPGPTAKSSRSETKNLVWNRPGTCELPVSEPTIEIVGSTETVRLYTLNPLHKPDLLVCKPIQPVNKFGA